MLLKLCAAPTLFYEQEAPAFEQLTKLFPSKVPQCYPTSAQQRLRLIQKKSFFFAATK